MKEKKFVNTVKTALTNFTVVCVVLFLFSRQVFRLAGHGLFSPSRTEVQWQIENILSAYGDGFTEDSHLIPYSPIRFGSAPETIIFHNIAQKAEGCQGGSAFSAEQDPPGLHGHHGSAETGLFSRFVG